MFFSPLAEIVEAFRKAGFFIMARKVEKLTPEQVAQLQLAHQGKEHYEELVNYMTRLDEFTFFIGMTFVYLFQWFIRTLSIS